MLISIAKLIKEYYEMEDLVQTAMIKKNSYVNKLSSLIWKWIYSNENNPGDHSIQIGDMGISVFIKVRDYKDMSATIFIDSIDPHENRVKLIEIDKDNVPNKTMRDINEWMLENYKPLKILKKPGFFKEV